MRIRNGVDLCEINRMLKHLEGSETFLDKCFTSDEREYVDRTDNTYKRASGYAARFAAKEAATKALGTGICTAGIGFKDIEVCKDDLGAPYIKLYGEAAQRASDIKMASIALSLTHEKDYAVAMVTILTNEEN